jgi:hypothetical protein
MKFLLLLWIAIGGIFDASIRATAAWCVLYYFSNVSWLQCIWIFLVIHFLENLFFVKYISTYTKEDCFSYIRRESILVGSSIISAPIISIFPTVAAIALLSILQVWTNLETHWLHTWLFVTCLVYSLLKCRETRRMSLHANSKVLQRRWSSWKLRTDPGARMMAKDVAQQPHRDHWVGSQQPPVKMARSAPKATNGPRSGRVIDV